MTYQFDIIVRDQKSHRIITTDCSCISEPALWFSDIWNKIRTNSDFGAKKQIGLNAFYLFEKGGGRIMPYEGNVGSYMLYGRALKAWLLNLFNNLVKWLVKKHGIVTQARLIMQTKDRSITIYIQEEKEDVC